jgi:Fe-S oxidoreductase
MCIAFIACFNATLLPETSIALTRLLECLGYAVTFPLEQICCGQVHYKVGYQREVLLLRHFVHIFGAAEAVAGPPASCWGKVREHYQHHFAEANRVITDLVRAREAQRLGSDARPARAQTNIPLVVAAVGG